MNTVDVSAALVSSISPKSASHAKKRKRDLKNLYKRGNVWWFKMRYRGKMHGPFSLETSDVEAAKPKARVLRQKVIDEQWAKVMPVLGSRAAEVTLGKIFEVFKERAVELDADTVRGYCTQLRNIVRTVKGREFDVDGASLSVLTADLLTRYKEMMLRKAGDNHLARERTKRTVRSMVINARAVFGRGAMPFYSDLNLAKDGPFKEFLEWSVGRVENVKYRLPPAELRHRTIAMGRRLYESALSGKSGTRVIPMAVRVRRIKMYVAFVLSYDLALRAGESAALKLEWFTERIQNGAVGRELDIFVRSDFKPKWGMERSIPVHADVWEHLVAARKFLEAGEKGFVVPGDCPTQRENLVGRELALWMRHLGWDESLYPKAAHELRKLKGSEWFTFVSPAWAQKWLGHKSIATTCAYYADMVGQAAPLGLAPSAVVPLQNSTEQRAVR
jgi:integrase